MVFNKKVYDVLKFIAQIALPALGTLWLTVSGLFQWPNTEEVVGTIMAVDFFLGTLLGISTSKYNKSDDKFDGAINISEDDTRKLFQLDIPGDPEELQNKSEVVLKVNGPE